MRKRASPRLHWGQNHSGQNQRGQNHSGQNQRGQNHWSKRPAKNHWSKSFGSLLTLVTRFWRCQLTDTGGLRRFLRNGEMRASDAFLSVAWFLLVGGGGRGSWRACWHRSKAI